jgi:aspartyl/asparaginyl beta-hydroxylase (cupin superfamily)
MEKFIILLIIFLIFILIYFYKSTKKENILLNKNFYTIEETFPHLNKIYNNLDIYKKEINNVVKDKSWINWVEKDLYDSKEKMDWKIFPFCGFNIWVDQNCQKCPELTKFLKSIPGLKIAILSQMTPGTKLAEHRGWANHSNHVLRCHFNFIIPKNCFISVGDKLENSKNIIREVKKYKQDKWIVFDDSKLHYTWNNGNSNRIVLILDIERPKNVKTGIATKGETKELIDLINSFKNVK